MINRVFYAILTNESFFRSSSSVLWRLQRIGYNLGSAATRQGAASSTWRSSDKLIPGRPVGEGQEHFVNRGWPRPGDVALGSPRVIWRVGRTSVARAGLLPTSSPSRVAEGTALFNGGNRD